MNYQVILNTDQSINLSDVQNLDASSFTKTLNDRNISFINFSGAIVNKNLIALVLPENAADGEKQVKIQLNNGQTIILGVDEDFNANEVVNLLNDRLIQFINIGKSIISKSLIGTIVPVNEVDPSHEE